MKLVFFIWCLFVLLLLKLGVSVSQQSNDMMMGLMAFKRSSIQSDPNGFLTNWTPPTTTTNSSSSWPTSCSWKGVICSTNGQVTALDLTNLRLTGLLRIDDLKTMENLKHLYLSGNNFSGDLSHNISLPCKFETIDLSNNSFSTPISHFFLPNCNRLISLNLSSNSIPGGDFTFGPSLQVLDLSRNRISDNEILKYSLSNCRNLKHLSFSVNNLSGKLFAFSISSWKNLLTLDLSNNSSYGDVLSILVAAESETKFSYMFLDLSNNNFSGNLSDFNLGSYGNLTVLNLSFNNLTGSVPLSLTNCTQLQVLDLSSNGFTGNLPSGFCTSSLNFSLEKILLADNLLSGSIPSELGNCKNLKTINLSFNNLRGSIPTEIWALPKLTNLIIWANNLSGEIPENICSNGGNLETLILNNNFISGSIPPSISNCKNLVWVSLSSNRLTGKIPTSIGNLQELAILQLGNNSLSGEIPQELGKCRSLIWLDLNRNSFMGSIPPELASQSFNSSFSFEYDKLNSFKSKWEMTLFTNRERDCEGIAGLNMLEGVKWIRLQNLLTCPSTLIHPPSDFYLYLHFGAVVLDISYNFLTGNIPESFGYMSVHFLNLRNNRLTGPIPYSFGSLEKTLVLDLSHNELEGSLPGSLQRLTLLTDLDVSNNHLTGVIPSSGQMTTFPAPKFENNSGLCGYPLTPCSSDRGTTPPKTYILPEKKKKEIKKKNTLNKENKKKHPFDDVGFLVSIELGLIVGFLGFWYVLWFKKSWRIMLFRFVEKMTDRFFSVYQK